jgi:GH35 family endo-1,4-beta-xylanase
MATNNTFADLERTTHALQVLMELTNLSTDSVDKFIEKFKDVESLKSFVGITSELAKKIDTIRDSYNAAQAALSGQTIEVKAAIEKYNKLNSTIDKNADSFKELVKVFKESGKDIDDDAVSKILA